MSTAIVILNYNDKDETIKYVSQIKDYDILDKIIVVDNNSSDKLEFEEIKDALKDIPKVCVIKSNKNGGYSYGNNYGLKYIEENFKIDYVIISNPDIAVSKEAIKKSVEYLEKNVSTAIVAPRMKLANGKFARRASWKKRGILIDIANSTRLTECLLYPLFKSGEYTKLDYESNKELIVDNIAGSFFICKMDILKKIGYFDENVFLFYEEDIIGNKIKALGYNIVSLNDIFFVHKESTTIGKAMNRIKKSNILFDSKIYYQKNYNSANKFQIATFKVLKNIRKFEIGISSIFIK